MRPSPLLAIRFFTVVAAAVPAFAHAQGPPSPPPPSPPRPAPAAADTDSTHRALPPNTFTIPGSDLQLKLNVRPEAKAERDRNLICTSVQASQVNSASGCRGGFIGPIIGWTGGLTAVGTIGDRVNVNIDYDKSREFDASQTVSLSYQGKAGSRLQRVDVGNIAFVPPASRFITSSLPSGNYGVQVTNQFGALRVRSIFAQQTGNVVQSRKFTIGGEHALQGTERDVDDVQLERLRFFFTVDPAQFGNAFPNIDILNRSQLLSLRNRLPESRRPTRVLLYRLQFGAQPQNANGPRFKVRGAESNGTQTYDVLREGVDYYMDPSLLWFELVRPLNGANERLVVAYFVKINGKEVVSDSTGGTPDVQLVTTRDQIANLVTDPSVGPSSPEFRNEIRSVYRVAGEELIRQSLQVRVVTGSGLLEHPVAGTNPTFLQMFGLAQSTSPAEFDYENRLWPRRSDPVFNLGAGAADVRHGASPDLSHLVHDYFIIFPSLRPFSARDSGLVVAGNPTNDPVYTTPGEYLTSAQRPASVYRLHLKYETGAGDENGAIVLGASQMRQGSERVFLDGRPLVRDLDYRINYDLGRLEFIRADTLSALQHKVEVSYEENPVFAGSPTTLAGFVTELPLPHGVLNFTAINQSQKSPFVRPELGFETNSTLTAGVTGQFNWDMPAVTRAVSRLPFVNATGPSHFSLLGEVATSRPQFLGKSSEAFLQTFDGGSGTGIALGDIAWERGSLPAYGNSLRSRFGGLFFETPQASTLTWQTFVETPGGRRVSFTRGDIDPLIAFAGSGPVLNEPVLWLTLLPLDEAGRYNPASRGYDWTVSGTSPNSRRFRSMQTVLSPAGIDLSNGEFLEFWTLVETDVSARAKNPTLIFDFGDVSENSVAFAPETLTVTHSAGGTDSVFTGKKLQGFNVLNTERDPFSHSFNANVNDTGLPGDVVDSLVVIDGATVKRATNVRICQASPSALHFLGDPATNCTIGNNKLDEEDIDQDNVLNFDSSTRENERILRYVVDLSDPAKYKRLGGTYTDTLFVRGLPEVRTRRWALVDIPFKTPTDSLNDVNRRRLRALRMTVVSGSAQATEEPTQFAIAELSVTGGPLLDRSSQVLAGAAGIREDGGFMITSTIGTNDSSATVVYQPPPGLGNSADTRNAQFSGTLTQINESSMRIQAGGMPLFNRAETYFKFPTGPQYFMGYRTLRVWGRGRGDGWGVGGDLQMYVKVGRDENNFYMFRAPMNAGPTAAAWTDLAIDLNKFIDLRTQIQKAYMAGKTTSIACTGVDSALIAASPLPVGQVVHRFAACDNGYMVYTLDPAVTPPNLAAVQEMAIGMVRVAAGTSASPIAPTDTLELWVDDVRLDGQVNPMGAAGQLAVSGNFGNVMDFRATVADRDPNFRELGERADFVGERDMEIASTLHLEKLLPASLGLAAPLTVTRNSVGNDPLFLSQSDISAKGIPGVRKPKNEITSYTLTLRRTTPLDGGIMGPLLNNLSATSNYVTGIDRTEFQDGNQNNLTVALDYLVAGDSARAVRLPTWVDGALGLLPGVLQDGPVGALRNSVFRWNPTQFRLTSGIVRGNDTRVSFLQPTGEVADDPEAATASSRLWRNGGVLEFRPTPGLETRLELQSTRDFRDYQTTVKPGFERDRTMLTSITWSPVFSAWFNPRLDVGTQYDMLRDPNSQTFTPLPGVIGVDSVLAVSDSLAARANLALPRRMTAAQTASVGSNINLGRAFKMYTRDSSFARSLGGFFAPVDLSYTRSLLGAIDDAPSAPSLPFQLGLGGPGSFRTVSGTPATTAGQTGTLDLSSGLLLPFGTSLTSRYRRTTTVNWIERPDTTQAHVDGSQTQFPDASLRWTYRPIAPLVWSTVDVNVGYVRSEVRASLPSLFSDAPDELRHTTAESFPVGTSLTWAGQGSLSTGARWTYRRQLDSLPGSLARTTGNDIALDVGRSFRMPVAFGMRDPVRARAGYQQSHNTTLILDETGVFQSKLQDNGQQAFNLAADAGVSDGTIFTLQASHVVRFDNALNTRFSQTVLSVSVQLQWFGAGVPK